MQTLICATCGCSLIRLGISAEQASYVNDQAVTYAFCCHGCMALFKQDPAALINETSDIRVCPTCLAEKPIQFTVPIQFEGQELNFCRCPYCLTTFKNNPQYYLDRLAGNTDFKGLFSDDDAACCH